MMQRLTDSRLANLGANAIHAAFAAYQREYKLITRRARSRFEACEWRALHKDAVARLELYRPAVVQVVTAVRALLEERVEDILIWASMKAVYSGLLGESEDWDLAETFFNSITRRIFSTVGLNPQIEFVDTDFETPPTLATQPVYRTYQGPRDTAALVDKVLADYSFNVPYADRAGDAERVGARLDMCLRKAGGLRRVDRLELVKSVFYRGTRAFLIGRAYSGLRLLPVVMALRNGPEGVGVDALLTEEDDVSILFSFARSYFHVEVERPYDLVRFIKSLVPRKRIAELYISLGYNKHGKTELYRDIMHHLAASGSAFQVAPGTRGLVMVAFTMPGYDLLFKVIKDVFPAPKAITRDGIKAKYQLVFKHDRAGRLVDAQEFELLKFHRDRFTPELLGELQRLASDSVWVEGDDVVIGHAYVERRVIPLNVYIREVDAHAARAAVVDYGNAIRDMAASNIFPGDMLLKNFGVTRHGRVVFYDYDELSTLLACSFRKMPQPRTPEEEMAAEPWFHVAENDIFPEEFRTFLNLRKQLQEIFDAHHADLYDYRWWCSMQERLRSGEVIEIVPYPETERLHAQ